MPDALQTIIDGLTASSKYRDLAPAALERTARWALERQSKPAAALKVAKRKLHQAFGAYLDPGALNAVDKALDELEAGGDLRDICSRVLRLHRSSAERRASLEAFYNVIWDETGLPTNVLDVAAGLNAFALPWMGLPAETRYHALEIDRRLCSATDRLLCATGLPGEATWSDVLSDFSPGTPDVALILKTLPCLEQQEPGASDAILTALASVPLIVITFPVRSLGGQEKGMRENYLDQIERLAGRNHRDLTVLPFDDELIAILRRAES